MFHSMTLRCLLKVWELEKYSMYVVTDFQYDFVSMMATFGHTFVTLITLLGRVRT